MYGSYLGDHYQAHILFSTNHQKVAENGGITDDNYITHPEIFSESYALEEIPVMMSKTGTVMTTSIYFSRTATMSVFTGR